LNLVQYLQADPPTNKTIAALVLQLIQFQEDNLGKNVSKPPLTRLPVSWFDKHSIEVFSIDMLNCDALLFLNLPIDINILL